MSDHGRAGLCLFLLSVEVVVCHAVFKCSPKVVAYEPPNLHKYCCSAHECQVKFKTVSLFKVVSFHES